MRNHYTFSEKVTVIIKQKNADAFLMALKSERVYITKLATVDDGIKFQTHYQDLPKIRKLRRKFRLKMELLPRSSDKVFRWNWATYIGVFSWIFIPYFFSFFIWTVTVNADTPEREVEIKNILTENNIHPLLFIFRLPDEAYIRQEVMKNDDELSWVHIERSGGKYVLTPLPAPIHNTEVVENKTPSHLIAEKSGVITHAAISSGQRIVFKDSTVQKGDVLVLGYIKQGEDYKVVGAEGAVYADYFLESNFSVPKTVKIGRVEDRKLTFRFLPFNSKQSNDEISEYWSEVQLPFSLERIFKVGMVQNVTEVQMTLEDESIENLLIPLLKHKLTETLSEGAIIKEENLLQVTIDNDTVKGKIIFLVNENIAKKQPIHQGDE